MVENGCWESEGGGEDGGLGIEFVLGLGRDRLCSGHEEGRRRTEQDLEKTEPCDMRMGVVMGIFLGFYKTVEKVGGRHEVRDSCFSFGAGRNRGDTGNTNCRSHWECDLRAEALVGHGYPCRFLDPEIYHQGSSAKTYHPRPLVQEIWSAMGTIFLFIESAKSSGEHKVAYARGVLSHLAMHLSVRHATIIYVTLC